MFQGLTQSKLSINITYSNVLICFFLQRCVGGHSRHRVPQRWPETWFVGLGFVGWGEGFDPAGARAGGLGFSAGGMVSAICRRHPWQKAGAC